LGKGLPISSFLYAILTKIINELQADPNIKEVVWSS
jgi:hypothetical protein